MTRGLKWFLSLSRRDFENGAVLDEIKEVFEERDQLREACESALSVGEIAFKTNYLAAGVHDKLRAALGQLPERRRNLT